MNKQVLENPAKNQDNLIIITALMITCYLTSNIMAVKLVEINGHSWFDAGTITFPLAYMLGDVLTEIWGYKTAKKVIYLTFICNLIMTLATYIGVLLPGASYLSEVNNAYEVIFTYTPRILIASLIAFLLGELTNAKVMELVKKATKEKYLFIRTILSSMAGYIFDTGVFVILAFYGTCKLGDLFTMIIVQYFIKVIIEAILATPLAYLIVGYLKKC